ncbi:hypothetical protein HK099_005348 [Clydaea vesicula]|uniref:Uncharacterized protein n=1 Tax=Clydaea vesicula TaxID=447962 RepID=A0AAD5UAE5_9FUNG|nr:hypothetical protein HK099_005348 [Clydaea vesicula]
MGQNKLRRYQLNAIVDQVPNEENSTGMRKLFWTVIGRVIIDENVNRRICAYLKYRHKYYKNTSFLLKAEEKDAVDSIQKFISNHQEELDNELGNSLSKYAGEKEYREEEVKEEEEDVISQDDDDEYQKKRSLKTVSLKGSNVMESIIPKDVKDYLSQLGDDEAEFKKNVAAFYKLKQEGKFLGREKQYVLVQNQQIVGFFDNQIAAAESNEDEGGLIQPIDENKTWGGKKRCSNSVIVESTDDEYKDQFISVNGVLDSGCQTTTINHNHWNQMEPKPKKTPVRWSGIGDGIVRGSSIVVSRVKIPNLEKSLIGPLVIHVNPPQEAEDETLIRFDVIKSYWMLSVPVSIPNLIVAVSW